jgi:hypothetical protein
VLLRVIAAIAVIQPSFEIIETCGNLMKQIGLAPARLGSAVLGNDIAP